MEKLTASQIRARIISSTGERDEEDDWEIAFARCVGEFGARDVLIAWAVAQDQYDDDAVFHAHELDDVIRVSYRQQWTTPAYFAEYVAEGETEMGDPEESKGRAWFLENYGEFIDWNASAESPKMANAYSMIMLDPKKSRVVHAFRDDDLRES